MYTFLPFSVKITRAEAETLQKIAERHDAILVEHNVAGSDLKGWFTAYNSGDFLNNKRTARVWENIPADLREKLYNSAP